MSRLGGFLLALFLLMMLASPQELAAQSFFSRLFGKGSAATFKPKKAARQKRFYCGEMDAYNKKRAYKKHRRNRSWKLFSRGGGKAEQTTAGQPKVVKRSSGPPSTTVADKSRPEKPSSQPPQQNPPSKPAPGSPPVVKDAPETPNVAPPVPTKEPVPMEKKNRPVLTRTSLKEMTEQERRDTLRQMEPEIELTPLQFLHDQDEFSVVNMDSFMKAMEYAQQGKIVLVEGHTDDLGREAYNLDLSMKRAEKIRELLLSGGIGDELISVIGYGESKPLVPNNSEENRAINRRIEFKIFSLPE